MAYATAWDVARLNNARRMGEGNNPTASDVAVYCELVGFEIDGILLNPQQAPIPTDPSTLCALAGALARRADQRNFGAVMTYAERWARMMEARMAKGERIADIADECSHLADEEKISGFMYGAAVSTLARVWKHGEALRMWHNLKTQIGTEGEKANESGGVLNPALLNIG